MPFSTIIFDFDGTLFNSRIGIVNAVKYALDALEIEHPTEEVLTSFIGPPLGHSFKTHFKLDDATLEKAIQTLREYYSQKGIFESEAYAGMEDLLKKLKQHGKTLAIATAKPTVYTHQILENHNWQSYFSSVRGSELKGELFPKEKTIGQVIDDLKIYDTTKAVMIGDTLYDIKGAQQHSMPSIGVLYGFGKKHDIQDARPNWIVENVHDLEKLLL